MQETQEMQFQPLDWEDLLEKEMATHSNLLVWKVPWTEEPGRLQSMGSQRVGQDRATEHAQAYKKGHQREPAAPKPCEDIVRTWPPANQSSLEIKSARTLILDFSASTTVRSIRC